MSGVPDCLFLQVIRMIQSELANHTKINGMSLIYTGISLSMVLGIPATTTLRPRFLISCTTEIRGDGEKLTSQHEHCFEF